MKEFFQWVPWFDELTNRVQECGREGLVERVKRVDWAEGRIAVLEDGENRADPFTFLYHLASIAGGKAERRITIYKSVADVFEIESPLDYSTDECFIFPIPTGFAVKFNTGPEDNTQLLWEVFNQACLHSGTASDVDLTDSFHKMLGINGVGVAKLTQVLFLINPRAFLPFDRAAILPLGIGKYKKSPRIHFMG